MKDDTAFVGGYGREEVEAANQLVPLNYKVIIIVEIVSEEPSQSVALKLVSIGYSLVSRLGEEESGLLMRSIGEVSDGLPCEDFGNLILGDREALLIAIQPIIAVAVQPVEAEEIGLSKVGNGADVLKVTFGDIVGEGFLGEKEPLRTAMLFIVGLQRDEGVVIRESDEDRVFVDTHRYAPF